MVIVMDIGVQFSSLVLRYGLTTLLRDFRDQGFDARIKRSILFEDHPDQIQSGQYGAVAYAAVETEGGVLASAIRLTAEDRTLRTLVASVHHESSNPPFWECPPYILEVLSSAATEPTRQWRNTSAALKWAYFIGIDRAKDDTRSIRIVLRRHNCLVICQEEKGISPDAFEKMLASYLQLYPMASVPVLPSHRSISRSGLD